MIYMRHARIAQLHDATVRLCERTRTPTHPVPPIGRPGTGAMPREPVNVRYLSPDEIQTQPV